MNTAETLEVLEQIYRRTVAEYVRAIKYNAKWKTALVLFGSPQAGAARRYVERTNKNANQLAAEVAALNVALDAVSGLPSFEKRKAFVEAALEGESALTIREASGRILLKDKE